MLPRPATLPLLLSLISSGTGYVVPTTMPSTAKAVDPRLLGVSLEFFTFPDYTKIQATTNCLANLQKSRGIAPPVRIGGTTQDRASYDASSSSAVTYTVDSPIDAPASLTYGPSFFTLAAALPGQVTVGLNRQLNNESNTLAAAVQAKSVMSNLLAFELGNEPEFYAAGSPIIPAGQTWSPATDATSQNTWFTDFGSKVGSVMQGAVYLNEPTWGTAELIPKLTTGVPFIKSFSGHSYPQSACGGAATNLTTLMSHTSIVSYTSRYKSEAAAAHNINKNYFLAETNSATCGGGGISPTLGAALWIVDYSLQAALNDVERLYFHQGTIAACPYCWWNDTTVNAPFYGAAFLSQALGTDTTHIAQLDTSTNNTAVYAFFNSSSVPVRILVINSALYSGSGTRTSTTVSFTGVGGSNRTLRALRLTGSSANAVIANGDSVTIGGSSFGGTCLANKAQTFESVSLAKGAFSVSLLASEALYIQL